MTRILFRLFLIATSASVIYLAGCGDDNSHAESAAKSTPQASAQTGERFSLQDLNGHTRTWSEFAGKPLVVNFWATWCAPCRMEMPAMKKLYEEYHPQGLEIVGISVDRNTGPVPGFVRQMQIPWVILYEDNKVTEEFKMGTSIPTTIFFDASGKEVSRFVGARPESQFRTEIEKILKASS